MGFQATFGNYKKVGSDLVTAVSGKSTHDILVQCFHGDVPYSEGFLRVVYGGTVVLMFGKAAVIQDWLDQNNRDGASQVCNFSATSAVYLGSQE